MTDAQDVLEQLVRAAADDGFRAHAVHVRTRTGTAAHAWSPDVRRDVHSIAKGVCVLAVGMACDEGLFDVDAPVGASLPAVALGPGVDEVTTRHLLGMTSGIDLPWSATLMTDWPDLAVEFLGRPTAGRVFQYSNASTYTAMRALDAVVGDVLAWLQPRLFEPLGIQDPTWERCPRGHVAGGAGLHLTIGELARLGRLIADDGVWDGRPLVSRRWTDAMHTDWVDRDAGPGYTRYALAGWEGPGAAWRLHGAHGQLLVFRGRDVVTITADDHAGADRMAGHAAAALERLPGG